VKNAYGTAVTLLRDVPLGGVIMRRVQLLGGTALLKFGRAKTSKIWRNLRQLSTLTANISRIGEAIDKRKTILSSRITREVNKNGKLLSTKKSYRRAC